MIMIIYFQYYPYSFRSILLPCLIDSFYFHDNFFLFFTSLKNIRLGFRAIGSDVNSAFVAGAAANLRYAGYPLVQTPNNGILCSEKDILDMSTSVIAVGVDGVSCDKDIDNIATSSISITIDMQKSIEERVGPLLQLFIKVFLYLIIFSLSCSLNLYYFILLYCT